ncbi:MAG: hypothetical protein IPO85_20020 [Saprospiraceae bacterium]|uniref:Uncharacterized protein n=1 Tax=Candidatus Defluviibacterium haderslevense TaxID=2981993 RepID=A0A9D7XJI3_9BACT|nr:hypothetical protein [Candidatus Defluviibacterium haderslevense]
MRANRDAGKRGMGAGGHGSFNPAAAVIITYDKLDVRTGAIIIPVSLPAS